tara:strand:+ start:2038 stop:2256 length:219 start_codon:yes stop_codon:yes gene_type:complete
MATVIEASGNGGGTTGYGIEKKYSATNRSVADVSGTITPNYVGERVTDVTGHQNYVATGTSGNTDWAVTNKV